MRDIKNQLQLEYEQTLFKDFGGAYQHMLEAHKKAESLKLLGISLSFAEASLLTFVVQSYACKKFVEIGTLTGFSALAILQGMGAGAELWSFEKNSEHAGIAQNILNAFIGNQSKKAKVIIGDAEVELAGIEKNGPFDGIFIDGNKAAYSRYLDWAEKNVKPGGLIIADNVFLEGSVYGEKTEKFREKQIQVMREFNTRLSHPQKYLFSLVPTAEGLIVAKKLF